MTHSATTSRVSPAEASPGVLTIDVGNSRIKLGWFPPAGPCTSDKPTLGPGLAIAAPALAMPSADEAVRHRDRPTTEWLADVQRWCESTIDAGPCRVLLASVHPAAAEALATALARAGHVVQRIGATDLPLAIAVERPERVGIDRLLNAVAAHRLARDRAAIVVDMGTATTVDLVAADGTFAGGAILPGSGVAAAALHAGTAALPAIGATTWDAPPNPVGISTEAAIAAGVYWQAVGAARELVQRIAAEHADVAQVILTGGAAASYLGQLHCEPLPLRHTPHLTLAGLNIAAERVAS